MMMNLNDLVTRLDILFGVRLLDEDPIKRWVDDVYQAIGVDPTRIFQADFCQRGNGLMMRAGERVGRVFCAAFPAPQVLEDLLAMHSGEALLFLHHPIDMEVAGEGFLPIRPDLIARLRESGVSIYSCHAPLDCHPEIGTNASIVAAFGIRVERDFSPYGNGFAARFGSILSMNIDELIETGQRVFGVERVEVGGGRPERITKVAVVAGGGDDLEDLRTAEALGAQAYLTGEWHPRLQPGREEARLWAAERNAVCREFAAGTTMALLGFSHAASEFLVMEAQMKPYFEELGLQVTCLPQLDWWR
ncbi:MAG: Nif3-like dinuclear metal center hexameric protein [Anaerolineales bacterium]|nr:Nif3-like dinuclear metal center hexameric protein [Anaerolineales bacterium]